MALLVAMAWAGNRAGFLFVCTRPMFEECMMSGVFVAPEEVQEEAKMIGRGEYRGGRGGELALAGDGGGGHVVPIALLVPAPPPYDVPLWCAPMV
jgi:hypothetical protein